MFRLLHRFGESVLGLPKQVTVPAAPGCLFFPPQPLENWVEQTKLHKDLVKTSVKDITPLDSVSNVSAKQKSGKSSSCSSQASSYASSATSIRLKEEANRAVLVAKAAALKEKQALALKEAQLKVDKEQLEIETELAASAARLKIYADYESPQQQLGAAAMSQSVQQYDDGQHRYETSPPRLKYQNRPVLPTNAPAAKPKVRADQRPNSTLAAEPLQQNDTSELYRVMKRQTDITELLVRNQQLSRLPQRDIPLFHGDPLEFRSFLKAFDHAIDSRTDSLT